MKWKPSRSVFLQSIAPGIALLFLTSPLFGANTTKMPNPDFTAGDSIPEGAAHDWNLGATGARGWMFSDKMVTSDARQIAVTSVEKKSPAEGVLVVGDVIRGVAGNRFSYDARTEIGKAITEAEAGDGTLKLIRWRDGKQEEVELRVPPLGSYSSTAPYDCSKSQRILEQGCQRLAARIADPAYRQPPITRSINALALLASGNPEYLPIVQDEARWAAGFSTDGFKTWHYGYVIMFLSEYVMASGDHSVMPGLKRLAMEAALGQSIVGSWGHHFAADDGRLRGYGMMNSPGVPLTIGLVLARKAGVEAPELDRAIERSTRLLRFYVGKGAIPYGDHHPWIQTHEDNGKCGMTAVLFNLIDETSSAEFFSRMSVASHGAERDTGHTGNFFNLLWAMPAVALSGPQATGQWMREYGAWYFDLARQSDGSFVHQGPPEMSNDSYHRWDCTGAYLLAYAMPLKKIYLTGKTPTTVPQLDAGSAERLVGDGRGWSNKDRNGFYDQLDNAALWKRLGSWSPVVRERAAMAIAHRPEAPVDQLIKMLDSHLLESRLGACQALAHLKSRAAPAVPMLRRTLQDDDLWLRIQASNALAAIGQNATSVVPELLHMLTHFDRTTDPRGMQQRYLAFTLFNTRGGMLGRTLEGVDRDLLFDAVRAGLTNEDGRARSSFSSVYRNLSYNEIKPLLPEIHRAIVEPAPSGIMFADGIQTAGLELLVEHRISEGIELLADYARTQKKHGSQKRIIEVMDLLKTYGTHAKRVIPELQQTAYYFENEETDFPRKLSVEKANVVRQAINEIASCEDEPLLIQLPAGK